MTVRAESCPDALRDAFEVSLCSGAILLRNCSCQRAETEEAVREEALVVVEGVGGGVVVVVVVVVVLNVVVVAELHRRTLPPLLRPHN